MSYYPPGVTGNEPEIAGYPEARLRLACDHDTVDMVPSHWVSEVIRDGVSGLLDLIEAEDESVDAECGFEGEVDVVIVDGILAQWTCPRCGQDVESELDA